MLILLLVAESVFVEAVPKFGWSIVAWIIYLTSEPSVLQGACSAVLDLIGCSTDRRDY